MESNKETLRRAMRAQRAALDAAAVRSAGDRVAEQLVTFRPYVEAESLLAYLAVGNEVPTAPIIEDARLRHKRIFVPRAEVGSFVAADDGQTLARPVSDSRSFGAALVLVPLLAWTHAGDRLGRGGGWYDRVLPRLGLPTIGVGYEFQERPQVPTEPWDVRLDFVVTESRLIECGGVLSAGRLL